MNKGNGKTSEKTSAKAVVGYSNLSPGNAGNRGGNGVVPSAIREHCRGSFAERVVILEDIADGEPMPMTKIVDGDVVTKQVSATIKDRTHAIDMLGKYGGVDKLALTVEELPEQEMTAERIAGLFEQIQRIKTVAQLEKLLTGAVKKQVAG